MDGFHTDIAWLNSKTLRDLDLLIAQTPVTDKKYCKKDGITMKKTNLTRTVFSNFPLKHYIIRQIYMSGESIFIV